MWDARAHYEHVLNLLLNEAADLRGVSGRNQRLRPISKTDLVNNRRRYFPQERFQLPGGIVPEKDHGHIKRRLAEDGVREGRLLALDAAYGAYVEQTLPVPERSKKSAEGVANLVERAGLRMTDLGDAVAFNAFLGRVVYEPTIMGRQDEATANISVVLGAFRSHPDLAKSKHWYQQFASALGVCAYSLGQMQHSFEHIVLKLMKELLSDNPPNSDVLRLSIIAQEGYSDPSIERAISGMSAASVAIDYTWDQRLYGADGRLFLEVAFLNEQDLDDEFGTFHGATIKSVSDELSSHKHKMGVRSYWNIRSQFVSAHAQHERLDDTMVEAAKIRMGMENSGMTIPQIEIRLLLDECRVLWNCKRYVESVTKYLEAKRCAFKSGLPLSDKRRLAYHAPLFAMIEQTDIYRDIVETTRV